MTRLTAGLNRAAELLKRRRGLLLPAAAVGGVFVILVPVPPAVIDVLLVASLALSALILLTAIHVGSPLEFSVLPSVLLGATMFRLVLNVATTRLILTAGGAGPAEAQLAAGRVVWAFSRFVTSGSLAVGVILFVILVLIQFIVITRGTARISEVAARFVLDALPGKQMAIDAEFSAHLIDEDQARHKRQAVAREADFYGAMDGASKFLRGDAVAGAIITLVSILGGLYVGLVQRGWPWRETADLFARLTIGNALVAQLPAFIVSISAALIVTRSTARTNLGEEVLSQLASHPVVLIITAVFLALLALTSLPVAPMLALGTGCVGLAWLLTRKRPGEAPAEPASAPVEALAEDVQSLRTVDPLRIEIGYGLVRLADPEEGGDLLDRIAALRRQVALELGVVVPPVRVRDDLHLPAHAYVIRLRAAKVAEGHAYPGRLLAVARDGVVGKLVGRETTEPVCGTPAVWIDPSQRPQADRMNYALVEPSVVLVTHLAEVIKARAAELLTRGDVERMLEAFRAREGRLVAEVTERYRLSHIHRLLQNLLRERVGLQDLERILEAAEDYPGPDEDLASLTDHVRRALGPGLWQPFCGADGKVWCVSLHPALEDALRRCVENTPHGRSMAVPPDQAQRLSTAMRRELDRLRGEGRPPVVLCSPQVRAALRQFLAPVMPGAAVLAYTELDAVDVRTFATVEETAP